jgi:metal-responsive CopG/Arc/MetJ family transcriptional regulator
MWYDGGMKRKTSVTLAEDVIDAVDRLAGKTESRSAVIERAVRTLVALEEKARRDARDLEIIKANIDQLNDEADDVLSYQVKL